jgi:hypothetical protein
VAAGGGPVSYDNLTDQQRNMFDKVHENAVWGQGSIWQLITKLDATAQDKAAVADAFEPGAGTEFLP